jgi:hypothetical protein
MFPGITLEALTSPSALKEQGTRPNILILPVLYMQFTVFVPIITDEFYPSFSNLVPLQINRDHNTNDQCLDLYFPSSEGATKHIWFSNSHYLNGCQPPTQPNQNYKFRGQILSQ